MRRKLSMIVGTVVAVAGIGAWTMLRGGGHAQYRFLPVESGNLNSTISASGTPNAVVTVEVGSQVSGNISALYADFNTKVKKGQVVARIDPQIFEARVTSARAALESAQQGVANAQANELKVQADIANAQANLAAAKQNTTKAQVAENDSKLKADRRVTLSKEGVISAEDLQTAQATYQTDVAGVDAATAQEQASLSLVKSVQAGAAVAHTQIASAQAQVKEAQANLEQAQIDLDHTFIRAPVDGTVVSRKVDVGQTVAASLAAPTIFEIAQDLTKMQVDTNVDEADVGRVRVGQPATFTVDAYPSMLFHGSVSAIREAPINTQNVITYDVVILVPNADLKLFPGMTANVKILVDRRSNVLKVPNSALRFRPPDAAPTAAAPGRGPRSKNAQPSQTVWVLGADNKPKVVPVKLGITDGVYSELISGDLHQGDEVITGMLVKDAAPAKAPSRGPGF